MVELLTVPAHMVDRAWRDGASALSKACDVSGGEITGDQLKMMLSRGERTLLRMDRDGEIAGWGVVKVDQLPNIRVLHVYSLYAPHGRFQEFFASLKQIAESNGCSEIRCCAKPAQARLYERLCGFEPVYTTMRVAA